MAIVFNGSPNRIKLKLFFRSPSSFPRMYDSNNTLNTAVPRTYENPQPCGSADFVTVVTWVMRKKIVIYELNHDMKHVTVCFRGSKTHTALIFQGKEVRFDSQ
jgi:hypothetical protein